MIEPPSPTRRQFVLLFLILAVAAFVRFYRIAAPSLWMDEIWSIEMAMGHGSAHDHLPPNIIRYDQPDLTGLGQAAPWWSVVTHLGGVTHPPLYFVVLRWWIDLFGTGPVAIRSLSAIFSLGLIFVLFDLCRLLHGARIALSAAAISALAIAQIEFAQESRGYPMLIFFGLCCADSIVRIEFLGPSRRRFIGLTLSLVATALTHYLSAGALISMAVYAVIRLRARARVQTLIAFAISAVFILMVWIPLFIEQRHTLPSLTPTFLREARVAEHTKMTLFRIIGLPIEYLMGESRGEAMSSPVVLTVFLLTLALPVIRLIHRRDLLLWVLWAWGTIGFVAVMDLTRQTTLVGYLRYTILASPAVYALIAAFDWPRRTFIRDTIAIAAIGLLAIIAIQRNIDGVAPKEDWQTLARDLNASAGPDDLLVFFNDDPWTSPGTWYMNLKYYTPDSHRPWLILNASADADVLHQLHPRQILWLIGRYPQLQGPHILPGWLTAAEEEKTTAGAFCPMVPTDFRSRR